MANFTLLKDFICEFWSSGRQISEVKPPQLVSAVSGETLDRATKRSANLSKVDKENQIWNYKVLGGSREYTVKIRVVGSLTRLGAGADIEITCNCPFFRWQGPEHWAKVDDYEYGPPAGTASFPGVMDPNRNKPICKHSVAALKKFEKSYIG
jgi:hypothetical protein